MKLGQFSRVPYEQKTKDLYSPKVRARAALTPATAAEFYAAQDIQSILPLYRREEPEEKKSPLRPVDRVSKDSSSEAQSPVAQDFKSRVRESLLDQVNFLEPAYSYSFDFAPSASFFKFLSPKPGASSNIQKLKMWVPDTVVFNDTDRPFWIYSNLNGEVCRFEGFNETEVYSKLPNSLSKSDASVLLKKPCYDHRRKRLAGNTTSLIPNEQLKDKVRMLTRGDGEKAVLQRYILNHGVQRFICRTVYQQHRMPYAWLITSTHPNAVITDNSANIVKVNSGKFLRDTAELVSRLVKFIEMHVKVTFEMLACDFIKDEGGLWWLINVKAFKISENDVPVLHLFVQKGVIDEQRDTNSGSAQLKEYTRQKRCEFCHVGFETLSHELTLKMIFEMEEHLRKRGKIVSWLENKEYRHIDEATLYQNYSVCDYCFKLYTETQVLKHIENDLAKAFGIPKKSDEAPVQELQLEVGIPLRVIKDDPTSHSNFASLSKFRFLLVLNEVQNANFGDNFSLEYDFLGKSHKVKLPASKGTIVLSRLRLFYIFSNGRGKFNLFLKRTGKLEVKLMEDGKEVSRVKLILSDFKSPFVLAKYYCEHFGDRGNPILTAHVGIVGEPAEKISDLTLRAYHEVYLPPDDYITCDPLPEEWLPVLPSIHPQLSLSQSLRSLPSLQPNSPQPLTSPHPSSKSHRRTIGRIHSSNPLFQQRYGEITALLTSPHSDAPLSKDLLHPVTTPKTLYPGCEDYTVTLHVISVNGIQEAEGYETWRLQWTAFETAKVVERKVEYGAQQAWLAVNEQVKIGLRAQESSLEKFLQIASIDFRALSVSASVPSGGRLSLASLLEEKYMETELPLVSGEKQVASVTVTVSIVKENQLMGKVVKSLYPGVHRLKIVA